LLSVTVVGGDEEDVVVGDTRVVDDPDGFVGRFDSLDGCVVDTRVADLQREKNESIVSGWLVRTIDR
jgi:hypothetical protein